MLDPDASRRVPRGDFHAIDRAKGADARHAVERRPDAARLSRREVDRVRVGHPVDV